MNINDLKYIIRVAPNSILFNEPMSKHTTFGVGGKTSCYFMPKDILELKKILKYTTKKNIQKFIAGSGSNLLVNDKGYDGIVISLKKTFKNLEINNDGTINVESGVMLGSMVKKATNKGIEGLESLIGVPGTVGGALYMNAGAYNNEISNFFYSAILLDTNGNEKIYKKNQVKFDYRHSSFPNDEILINAIFKFKKGNLDEIAENKKHASNKRKETQPLKYRSAGSIFKNPSKEQAAGYLIDQCGLKGYQIGGAEISNKHANFIINKGDANSRDIIGLIELAKKEVLEKFKIKLKLEVKLLGF